MDFSGILNSMQDHITGIYTKYNTAIILAGGCGKRAATGALTKQLVTLDGVPVIARTISAFEQCTFIRDIIVVIRPDEEEQYRQMLSNYAWKKIKALVPGGDSRQASVLNGFKKISDKTDFVYIHDGARCLITPEMIASVGHAACVHGAAFAACRPSDTVKHEKDKIIETIDRNTVWMAQTPQVFMTELYRAACYQGLKNGIEVTDDCSIAEAAGFTPFPVDCGAENIKITNPSDFAIAEAILSFRKNK